MSAPYCFDSILFWIIKNVIYANSLTNTFLHQNLAKMCGKADFECTASKRWSKYTKSVVNYGCHSISSICPIFSISSLSVLPPSLFFLQFLSFFLLFLSFLLCLFVFLLFLSFLLCRSFFFLFLSFLLCRSFFLLFLSLRLVYWIGVSKSLIWAWSILPVILFSLSVLLSFHLSLSSLLDSCKQGNLIQGIR